MPSKINWRLIRSLLDLENAFRYELAYVLKDISESYRFGDYEVFVETSWKVDGREADIAVFVGGEPFLILECKRAIEYSPWDDFPIGQVHTYALLALRKGYSVDFVATANQYYMSVFKVPENLENYANWEAIRGRRYDRAFHIDLYRRARAGDLGVLTIRYHIVPSKEELYHALKRLVEERRRAKPEPFSYRVIEVLRSFVDFLAEFTKDYIKHRIENSLLDEYEQLKKRRGVEQGYGYSHVAKEFAYTLMNRILFYKVLERYWRLEKLEPLYGKTVNGIRVDNGEKYFNALKHYFRMAVKATGNFEPVFILDFYDKLSLPDYLCALKAIDGLIQDLDRIELERLGDVIGYIYEETLNPQDRHQFGQFYTPHGIAELITRWCIRSQSDLVLDPGSGSGTFLVEAYKRLYELKTGQKFKGVAESDIHKQILSQLYAIDIDEFACHLTAMNLALRNVLSPSREVNVIHSGFFLREPGQEVLLPYKVVTVEGLKERKLKLPIFDCVVGNPPYTRWTEIPERIRNNIKGRLRNLMKKYDLVPQVARGLEPQIYVFWIMHAEKFLKEGGRLGMIISNLWLQTDYGVKFANYLLDHFKIHAIIDIPLRLFQALITTTIILLEKCSNKSERENNEVVFIRLPPNPIEDIRVEEVLKAIKERKHPKFAVYVYKQGRLSRSDKWVKYLFGITEIEKSDKMVELGELFEISRGNTLYSHLASRRIIKGTVDLGSNEFFYFNPSKARYWSIPKEYLYPAITSSRQMRWFTFKKKDWEDLKRQDAKCLIFICHKPRSDLPDPVKNYIKWGETECTHKIRRSRTRGKVRTANQAEASQTREKYPQYFYGWYDLGGVKPAKILAVRQARYKTRFVLCEFPVVTYDAILCFIPKVKLKENQLKALLAYLNSSFAQFYVETKGRYIAQGPIALEISQAERMPVLDPRKLSKEEVDRLARLFDKLEAKARAIGGASEKEQIEKLEPIIYEIDKEIGEILGLSEFEVCEIEKMVEQLVERRVAGARRESRTIVKGEEEIPKLHKDSGKRDKGSKSVVALDKWLRK